MFWVNAEIYLYRYHHFLARAAALETTRLTSYTQFSTMLERQYSWWVLAQLPRVRRDADNATAAAFRSAQTCIVNGNDLASGAVVVPLTTPAGCVGVLAVELRHGSEQRGSVRALATIFAAQLAMLVGTA